MSLVLMHPFAKRNPTGVPFLSSTAHSMRTRPLKTPPTSACLKGASGQTCLRWARTRTPSSNIWRPITRLFKIYSTHVVAGCRPVGYITLSLLSYVRQLISYSHSANRHRVKLTKGSWFTVFPTHTLRSAFGRAVWRMLGISALISSNTMITAKPSTLPRVGSSLSSRCRVL